jgi:pSer/pThr/pTyr-binding forkhead associated (FHA) protein
MIPSSGRRIILKDVRQIDIGRMDERKDIEPSLDLTQDDGARHGVSRRHALIRFTARGAILMDLNSTNGTVLNRYRLMPERPYLLRTGDEIQFGRLLTHVFID